MSYENPNEELENMAQQTGAYDVAAEHSGGQPAGREEPEGARDKHNLREASSRTSEKTWLIPPTELTGIEAALAAAENYDTELAPLLLKAERTAVTDRTSYLAVGGVLSETRGIEKQIKAQFAPFNAIVERVEDFLSIEAKRHLARCDEIEAVCLAKMKPYEQKEREAAAREQKTHTGGTVKPDLPAIAGYRKTVSYPVEVTGIEEFLKDYRLAVRKKDGARIRFLERFIELNVKELAEYSKLLRDPERFMREIKGVRSTKV